MNKVCRDCGDELNHEEKNSNWGDTCFNCVKESMTPFEYFEEFEQ